MTAGWRALALVLAAPALALAACAQPQRGPADTLAGFGAAVERRDYPAAYALMSGDYRKRVSLGDFRAQLEAGGGDVPLLARRLKESAGKTPLRIEVEVEGGEKLALIRETGEWRVEGPAFNLYDQSTPRAALRSLLRALAQRRYDVAVRLVPNRYRAGVDADKLRDYWEGARTDQNQKLLRQLRANLESPIIEVGDEARMPYGEGAEVLFVREDGLWKVEDPD
jgi:hypothetical protein